MGRRILAVDDNEIVGWTLRARLWACGYEVEVVSSAAAAFEALATSRFDLVLLDLNMPEVDGLEALAIINERQLCPGVPVVLLTASDELSHVRQARDLGARGYLTKANASEALTRCVEQLITSTDTLWLDDHHCIRAAPADAPVAAALGG